MNYIMERLDSLPSEKMILEVNWDVDDKKLIDYPPFIQIEEDELEELKNKYCPEYSRKEHSMNPEYIKDILHDICEDISDDIQDSYDCFINGFKVIEPLEIN